jgi:hypothetical protein
LFGFWLENVDCGIFGLENVGVRFLVKKKRVGVLGGLNEIEGFEGCGIRVKKKKKKKKKVEEFISQKIDSWDSKNLGLGVKKKNNSVLENWVGRRRGRDLEDGELG